MIVSWYNSRPVSTVWCKIISHFPEPQGPMGRRWSLFPVALSQTSRCCKTTDTGPVHRVVCPFTPQLFCCYSLTVPGGIAHWVVVGAPQPRAGFEPTTLQSQVRHCTTRPWCTVWWWRQFKSDIPVTDTLYYLWTYFANHEFKFGKTLTLNIFV